MLNKTYEKIHNQKILKSNKFFVLPYDVAKINNKVIYVSKCYVKFIKSQKV